MSVDFTFALAGQSAGSDAIRQQLERELKELGYRRSPDEIPVGFDRTRGVFDEVEGGIGDEPACGWAVEYDKDGCTLYLLVALHRDGYVNAFVDVSGRTLERLVQEGALSILLAAVGAAAMATHTVGGFGTFELPFEPIPPTKILQCIAAIPHELSVPALLGLVSAEAMSEETVRATFGPAFEVKPWTRGYWLLEHEDLRD